MAQRLESIVCCEGSFLPVGTVTDRDRDWSSRERGTSGAPTGMSSSRKSCNCKRLHGVAVRSCGVATSAELNGLRGSTGSRLSMTAARLAQRSIVDRM